MPFNGSGVFSIINSFTPNTTIASSPMNANFTDIASGLTDCLTRDGQAPMTASLLLINGSNSVPSLSFAADPTNGIYRSASGTLGVSGNLEVDGTISQAGYILLPAGIILPYGGSAAPTGFLLCYGQAVSRTTYATLFTAISTSFGAGDGVTTFNVPDLRGRGLAGLDNMGGSAASRLTSTYFGTNATTVGATGGLQSHTLIEGELPVISKSVTIVDPGHAHSFTTHTSLVSVQAGGGANNINQSETTGVTGSNTTGVTGSYSFGSGNAHAIVQPTMVVNCIIKY